jgi:hypothetical protein
VIEDKRKMCWIFVSPVEISPQLKAFSGKRQISLQFFIGIELCADKNWRRQVFNIQSDKT